MKSSSWWDIKEKKIKSDMEQKSVQLATIDGKVFGEHKRNKEYSLQG